MLLMVPSIIRGGTIRLVVYNTKCYQIQLRQCEHE